MNDSVESPSLDDETKATRYINREMSWLDFNARVLEEAANPRHPLLERVRFVAISGSNLDEFYSVRIAGLVGQERAGVTMPDHAGHSPAQQLRQIRARAQELMQFQQDTWLVLRELLHREAFKVVEPDELSQSDLDYLDTWFSERAFPVLTPLAVDPAHPFPFLPNTSLCIALKLIRQEDAGVMTALIPIPPQVERFVALPAEQPANARRFMLLEEVIGLSLYRLFPGFIPSEKGMFRLIRDTDVEFEEEANDLVQSYETALKKRRRGRVIHLSVNRAMSDSMVAAISTELDADASSVVVVDGILGVSDLAKLIIDDRPDLLFTPYTPRFPERILDFGGDCFAAIRAKDIVVHHPYESFDVVVQFLRQAAKDPNVIAIKQTLYRTSTNSPIVRALIEASEAGKSVTAMVELKARFDEERNIALSRELEAAGVQVVYGFIELKTHAKVSLVVRREASALRSYAHFGTGNYHPITAKVYTDLSFFTADPQLTEDAQKLFNYMTGYATPNKMNKIAFSPVTLRPTLLSLIAEEIEHARAGRPAAIWLKMNSLVDEGLIDALYNASMEGVEIDCVIRGICCLRPNFLHLSKRIRVKSIVGRFLEHSRIVAFGSGYGLPHKKARLFISTADWMPRNMEWRVETLVPIENPTVHAQILNQIMVVNFKDDQQSWDLRPDGSWARRQSSGEGFSAHEYFLVNPSLSGRGSAGGRQIAPGIHQGLKM